MIRLSRAGWGPKDRSGATPISAIEASCYGHDQEGATCARLLRTKRRLTRAGGQAGLLHSSLAVLLDTPLVLSKNCRTFCSANCRKMKRIKEAT